MNDLDAAKLCAGIYAYAGEPAIAWDHFDAGDDDDVCWALKRIGDCDVVVFRGSVKGKDWWLDLQAFANPFTDGELGPVHPGFLHGMAHVFGEVNALLRPDARLAICGHSLGAARAAILTAMFVLAGRIPASRIVFGEPLSGFALLASIVARAVGRSYRNTQGVLHDQVTDWPHKFGVMDYRRATPLIDFSVSVPSWQWPDPFAFHHMQIYRGATAALTTIPEI